MVSERRLVVIGAGGSPVGGISSFIKTLYEELSVDNAVWIVDPYPQKNKVPISNNHILLKNKFPYCVFELINCLRKINPDIVYLNYSTTKSFAVLPFLRFVFAKIIVSLHHGDLCDKGFLKNLFQRLIFKTLSSGVDLFVPLSSKQLQFYKKNVKINKISSVCEVFISGPTAFEKPDDVLVCNTLLDKDRFDKIFLITGYDKDIYNHSVVENYLSDFHEKKICLVKVLYGNVALQSSYTYEHNSLFVLCVGAMPQNQFNWLLNNIDVYVRPTSVDSLGLVAWQSAFLKKVVIASNVCNRPYGSYLYDHNNYCQLRYYLNEALYSKLDSADSDPSQNLIQFKDVLGLNDSLFSDF